MLEIATALALATVAGVLGFRLELIGFGWLAIVGVAVSAIDLRTQRLPNRLVYPAYPVVLISLLLGALAGTDPTRLVRSLIGALVLGGCYLVLAVVAPGQLGLGDVKLAGLLGLALAWAGWRTLLFGGCLAFLLSAGTSLLLLATRRITLKSAIPFGPFMLAGAALALIG
jgi:leader peptidase (prepilin peptidase) / N-methyltransferase